MTKVAPLRDAREEEAREALPVNGPSPPLPPAVAPPAITRDPTEAFTRPPGTIDRAKLTVRRGSRRLIQIFEPKQNDELQLDLDNFYTARIRRRTHLEDEISGTLLSGGVDIDPIDSMSPTKSRGIMMTLSPGEEYVNHQNVSRATQFQQSALLSDDMDDDKIAEETDGDDGANDDVDGVGSVGSHSHLLDPPLPGGGSSGSAADRKQAARTTTQTARAATFGDAMGTRKNGLMSPAQMPVASPTLRELIKRSTFRTQAKAFSRSKKMINPHGRIRLVWDILSISFILYNAFVLPFRASFDRYAESQEAFDVFLDQFFIFDMLVTFNTAVDVDGSVQYSRRAAAKAYLSGWFIVDVVAAIPYDDIVQSGSSSSSNSSLRHSLKLLRLVRLLRLFRISRIFRRIQNAIFIRSTLTALFKYVLMVVFVSHWFSCIFHAIAATKASPVNWITVNKLQDPVGTKWDRYAAALYFAVMTLATIGFGDVAGTNADERLFSIFAMITGGGIFAYGITNIVELVSSLTIAETRFRTKMDEVNEYMAARELPMKLRIEIREFYHNTRVSRESRLNGEQQILGDLSSKLRSKIALSINDQFLRKFPFFAGSEPNFLLELALNMRMIHFAPLEDVIIEGEIGHEMFFIFRGAVEILRNDTQIGILGENQYFGEMAILSPDNRRRATVRTLCFCELRMLSRNRFLEALALFPAMQTKMAQVARARQQPKPPSPTKTPAKTGSASKPTEAPPSSSPSPEPSVPQDKFSLLPEPTLVRPSYKGMASSSKIPTSQRQLHMATTAARLNTVVRRPTQTSNHNSNGISAAMAQTLVDINGKLEEAMRRQEMLVAQLVKMQSELERLLPSD